MTAAMCGIAGGRFIEFNNENAAPSGFERGIGEQGAMTFDCNQDLPAEAYHRRLVQFS